MEDAALTLVQTWDEACDFKEWLGEQRNFLALDTETTGLNVGRDHIRLTQFGDSKTGWAFDHNEWRGLIREVCATYEGQLVFWNANFDVKMLKAEDITIPQHRVDDAMIMGHLLDPVRSNRLKDTAARYLGKEARAGQQTLKRAYQEGGWDWSTIPIDHPAYWQYSTMDTVLTARVAELMWSEVQPYRHIYEIELAFISLLKDAELAGMQLDVPYIEHARNHYARELERLTNELEPYNVEALSDRQVIKGLQAQGVVLTQRTEKGALSVDKTVLKPIRELVPLASLVLDYREAYNIWNNYLCKMLNLRDDDDRLHCSTRPVGARTGRTSVTDPPLQTIPRGRVVRDGFIAREGCVLVLADYAGMELRAMAADAGETAMIEAFERGEDVHVWTASQIYSCALEEVTREMRDVTKNAGFAKIYGAGVEKFSATAGVPVAQGAAFLERYDELFPHVRQWQSKLMAEVNMRRSGKDWGYTTTPMGRKLPIEPDKDYVAPNYRIQGGCAEAAKRRAVELDRAGLGEYFRLFVHDEFQLEVPREDAGDVLHELLEVMRDDETFGPRPGLIADGEVVERWGAKYHNEDNPLLREVHE